MKIEVLKGGIKHMDDSAGRMIHAAEGDVIEVRDELAKFFLAHGWAKDAAGKHPHAEQKPGVHVLDPDTLKQIQ